MAPSSGGGGGTSETLPPPPPPPSHPWEQAGAVTLTVQVSKRRRMGRQLTFLLGKCVELRENVKGGLPPPWRSAVVYGAGSGGKSNEEEQGEEEEVAEVVATSEALPSDEVQLVIDTFGLRCSVLGKAAEEDPETVEAELVMGQAISGERVRATGSVHRVEGSGREGSCEQWEVRVEVCALLRPRIRVKHSSPNRLSNGEPAGGAGGSTPRSAAARPKFCALPPREAAVQQLRTLSHEQRRDKACEAASDGDVCRLDALATLGFSLDAPLDDYGQTALIIAAGHGHLPAVRALLRHGASPNLAAHGGVTAASAAAAQGHAELLSALADAGADLSVCGSEGLAPIEYVLRRARPAIAQSVTRGISSAAPASLVRLIAPDADHPGAGSCYIDGGVPEAGLCALEALFERLPIHPRRNCSQALSDRSYFCDAEGWVSKLLNDAMQAGRRSAEEVSAMGENAGARAREAATGLPCEGEAIMHMRFLIYAEAGGGLPPHTDLSRTRRDGKVSSCTFLLYLTDCNVGGQTVLLERVQPQPCKTLAAVTPRRGRLLLFPHICPHRADEVVAEGLPKLLLRGEVV